MKIQIGVENCGAGEEESFCIMLSSKIDIDIFGF